LSLSPHLFPSFVIGQLAQGPAVRTLQYVAFVRYVPPCVSSLCVILLRPRADSTLQLFVCASAPSSSSLSRPCAHATPRLPYHSFNILSKCHSYPSGSTANNTLMSLCPIIVILILAKTRCDSCRTFCTSPSSASITLAIFACLLVPLLGSRQSHSHRLLVTPCPAPISLFGCTPLPRLRRLMLSVSGLPVSNSSRFGSQQSS
jgi:hypothetical protein